jgi:hypothetical protein
VPLGKALQVMAWPLVCACTKPVNNKQTNSTREEHLESLFTIHHMALSIRMKTLSMKRQKSEESMKARKTEGLMQEC